MTKPRKDIIRDKKRVLSWGLGRQSTALAVMSVNGDIPPYDLIIFADTGWELKTSYEIFDVYTKYLEERGATVARVGIDNVFNDGKDSGYVNIPLYQSPTGAPLQRQCTNLYKIEPVRRYIRNWLGHKSPRGGRIPKGLVSLSLGIAYDEYKRMRDSDSAFIVNEFPLVDMKITTPECLKYLEDKDLPLPPKSACICCPFSNKARFLQIKNEFPEDWEKLVEFDNRIRQPTERMVKRGFTGELFLTNELVPITDIKLIKDQDSEVCETGYCFV